MLTYFLRKKTKAWGILLGLSLILFPLISHALSVQEVPNPQQQYGGWVTDMANILSEGTEIQLNQMISELEATTGAEIAVVTVPATAPSPTPKAFTTELFNEWGIGKAGVDNGVLFLTSVGDRRVEIETGYGVEGILPDTKVGNIITTQITPKLRQGDWDGGILAGTEALVSELSGNPLETGLPESSIPTAPIGASSILALGLSLFGYNKAKYIARQPISLKPQGRSQVMGQFEDYLWQLYAWTALALLSISIALLLASFIVDPSRTLWEITGSILLGLIFLLLFLKIGKLFYQQLLAPLPKLEYVLSLIVMGFLCGVLFLVLAGFTIFLGTLIFLNNEGQPTLGAYGLISLIVSGIFSLLSAQVILSRFDPKLTFECYKCQNTLTKVPEDILSQHFTQPQQVAKQLGSTRFEGWHCTQCYPSNLSPFHLRRYILNHGLYSECPTCQEFTVILTDRITLQSATYSHSGLRQITYQCQSCNYRKDKQEIIPQLTDTSSSNSSSSSSSSGSSGSSSSGGSFGGGSSGGGGAGGDF